MNFHKNEVWSFSKSKKSSLFSTSDVPGPGRYGIDTGIKIKNGYK